MNRCCGAGGRRWRLGRVPSAKQLAWLDFLLFIGHFGPMDTNRSFVQLETYIRDRMRMSHVYQPVMLRVLLENGGSATIEEVAKALLSYDRSQVEYYEIRAKNMVGKVLIAERDRSSPIKDGRRIARLQAGARQLDR